MQQMSVTLRNCSFKKVKQLFVSEKHFVSLHVPDWSKEKSATRQKQWQATLTALFIEQEKCDAK